MPQMIKCAACGADISSEALACPKCGHPVKATDNGKSTKTKSKGIGCFPVFIIFSVIALISIITNRDRTIVPDHPDSSATESTSANPSVEQLDHVEKDIHDETVKIAFLRARQMKKAARNPDSFVLEQALLINGTDDVCYTYRAQNGFGGMSREYAVLNVKTSKFYTSSQTGFHAAWDKYCNGKNGEDISTMAQP